MMSLVTIAVPVYKRLDCLHLALQSVAEQDYPLIELIVSDNGQNGPKLREIVEQWYPKPFIFRENSVTVSLPEHHAQLVDAASGRYFAWLPDDDTISRTYVSELVRAFDNRPDVAVAIARQQEVDISGNIIRCSPESLPDYIEGADFIRNWTNNGFASYTSIVARTDDIRRCGGYLDCPWGNHSDDALMLKLCLSGGVAYSKTCAYRLRYDTASFGWSIGIVRFAEDTQRFLSFLESDPCVLDYARQHPESWTALKQAVVKMTWEGYYHRWASMQCQDRDLLEWIKAAFALPFLPEYYRAVGRKILSRFLKDLGRLGGGRGYSRNR